MSTPRELDLSALIDARGLGRFPLKLMMLSCVVTFFDGFDFMLLSFVSPYLRESFRLGGDQIGNLFGIGMLGVMIGGFFFGWLGDQIGRRPAILYSVAGFAVTTLALGTAGNYPMFLTLRLLNGIALGGFLPLIWVLNIEYARRHARATVVTLIMTGYVAGTSSAGVVTDWIAPHFGWRTVFIGSGVLTLVVFAVLYFLLPESLRFLILKRNDQPRAVALLQRIAPDVGVQQGTVLTLQDEVAAPQQERFPLASLFAGPLKWITPLLWLAYIGSSMTLAFKASWGPIILEDVGFTRTQTAYLLSATSALGAVAGLALMRFTDRIGPIAICMLPLVGAPLLVVIGLYDLQMQMFSILLLLAMTALGGMQFGMHSIAGMFYPSVVRGKGAGVASSVARLGAIAAPIIGGYLFAAGFPMKQAFSLLAITSLLAGGCILMLSILIKRAK